MRINIEGFILDDLDVVAPCATHSGWLYDAPEMVHHLNLDEQSLSDFMAGLWGIGVCPAGKHFEVWRLPEFKNRINATIENPLGLSWNFPLDNFKELI